MKYFLFIFPNLVLWARKSNSFALFKVPTDILSNIWCTCAWVATTANASRASFSTTASKARSFPLSLWPCLSSLTLLLLLWPCLFYLWSCLSFFCPYLSSLTVASLSLSDPCLFSLWSSLCLLTLTSFLSYPASLLTLSSITLPLILCLFSLLPCLSVFWPCLYSDSITCLSFFDPASLWPFSFSLYYEFKLNNEGKFIEKWERNY